jgi:hypothetical protein
MNSRYEIKRCNHDQELVSVLVEIAADVSPERQDALKGCLLRCPHCNERDLSGVQEPYACPKCKTLLIEGADGGRWD